MFQKLAAYILQGRKQAIVAALLLSVIPFLGWLGVCVMLLVTLRKGAKEGAIVLLWILLPVIALAASGQMLLLYDVGSAAVSGWVFACVLRQVGSWRSVVDVAAALGLLVVLGVHLFHPDITGWWLSKMDTLMQPLLSLPQVTVDEAALRRFVKSAAQFATGAQVLLALLGSLCNVGFARWMQGKLFNPGGFRQELLSIRLGWVPMVIMLLTAAAAALGAGLARDCLVVAFLPGVIAGLSVLHHSLEQRSKAIKRLIWPFYVLTVLYFPYIAASMVLLAVGERLRSAGLFRYNAST